MSAIEEVSARPTSWAEARVAEVDHPTADTVRLRLEPAEPTERQRHRPGQHYLVRLRAPDGYTAQRSYSLASDPADALLELLVERL
ncbi:MAG: oxidoreductase, partial [Marmoricola sp.]|nr:oxidoreductase [Marmoricola sp.]